MNEFVVEMFPVSSSNVQAIGYDEANQILYVRFTNNTLYSYQRVPIAEFYGLQNAPSVGSYFHVNIKKGPYVCQRLE